MILDSDQLIDAMEEYEVLHKFLLRDLAILIVLGSQDRPINGDSLAAWIGTHPNTARQRLAKLAEWGLVTREVIPRERNFGKQISASITPAGRTVLGALTK